MSTPICSVPTTSVELAISCNNLADMDTFSKSDPFAVLYLQDPKTQNWVYQGRTETIDNTLDPQWVKKFVLDYQFEMRQMLRVTVFDSDRGAIKLEDNDLIGTMECSLGEVVAADGAGLTRKLEGKKEDQTITMVAEELVASREVVKLKLIGKNLERKDWCGFGSSDPFLTILRANDPGQWFVVHRTEVMKGDLSPDWLPLEMTVSTLCNADHNRPLKLRVEDWNVSGSHDLIGEVETTLADLMELQPGSQMPLVNPKKRSKGKKYKNSGVLVLISHLLEERPTFLDYIQGGMELSFTVAIDFTASNGNPASSNSLHHVDPKGKPNQYLVAIKAVGDIIQDYDTDQMFPALGFGARLPPCGQVQHDFFLNMSSESPYCKGVDGIVDAYHQALDSVELYGPTNFAPVINHVAKIATLDKRHPSNYQVLLIITDGIITDMEATKAAIIAASDLPMSIIIIGVGSVNFAPMEELDSDRHLLQLAKRDIVQFVELNQFMGGSLSGWDKEQLAREVLRDQVLAELPDQIVEYMHSNGHKPGLRLERPSFLPIKSCVQEGSVGVTPSHRTNPSEFFNQNTTSVTE